MKRIACTGIGLVLVLGVAGLSASAQNQAATSSQDSSGSSLGDYARQVRKDPSAKAKPKVFDNDNLPREDKLSVVGTAASENPVDNAAQAANAQASNEAKPAGEGAAAASGAAPMSDKDKQAANKQWQDKITAQKDSIDLLTRELDVLQREYQVRAAAMYADAGNRMRNSADWDKQDAQYKQQIAEKQKALDDAKAKMDDLREDARKAGVPSSQREPAEKQ